MSAKPLVECPKCHELKLVKLIGSGAAIIIKDTENPCYGGRCCKTKKEKHRIPKFKDRLGKGKNKNGKPPWWRKDKSKVDKKILKNPEQYIKEGKVD